MMEDMSRSGKTNIAERMRLLSETRDGLPDNWHELAEAVDAAAIGFFGNPQTHTVAQFMGAMARARMAWCNATGDSLV